MVTFLAQFTATVVAVVSTAAIAAPHLVTRVVPVMSPTIIAFVPPDMRTQKDDGAIEGVAHVRFALDDTSARLRWFELRLFSLIVSWCEARGDEKPSSSKT
jgi:hypothetical protein